MFTKITVCHCEGLKPRSNLSRLPRFARNDREGLFNTLLQNLPAASYYDKLGFLQEVTVGILVTNDDGIQAPGLWALVKELQSLDTVIVVAPDREQSGVGTSVTLHQPLRVNRVKSPVEGIDTYSVEGTPADSVILAVNSLAKDKIDLVVSGINEGPNLGNDFFISGTVGAALQGYFYEIPAIAISVATFEDFYFDAAAKLARLLTTKIKDRTLPQKMLLNINVPNLPPEDIRGIELTKLAERSYSDSVEPGHDGRRQYYWIKRGKPHWVANEGNDAWAVEQNRISLTPFPNNPSGSLHSSLRNLAPILFQELCHSAPRSQID